MEFFSSLKTEDVIVPAEFIDQFMTSANGDYVKVYLWLLKNGNADIEEMADRLMLTEGDVKRAIRYWQDKSVLGRRKESSAAKNAAVSEPAVKPAAGPETPSRTAGNSGAKGLQDKAAAMEMPGDAAQLRECYRGTRCTEILSRLAEDADFRDLLIIVQKYLLKILDERETQVFAYLYDGLKLPAEVLDYLVAYAVEHDHANIRYIEKLGTDWASVGVRDVKAAKRRTKQFEEAARTASKAPAAKNGGAGSEKSAPRTDYNELVMQELLRDMGD